MSAATTPQAPATAAPGAAGTSAVPDTPTTAPGAPAVPGRDDVRLDLYLVTDTGQCGGPDGVVRTVRAAIRGGVTLVQVRDPHATDEDFLALARRVVEACHEAGVPCVLNDRVHLVAAAGADGAHVGQGDMPPAQARALLGPDAILGLSCQTREHVDAANALPAGTVDHLGLGPVYEQATKPDAAAAQGPSHIAELARRSSVPTVAIGGVNLDRLAQVRPTGVDGPCVVSAICTAPDPKEAARALRARWEELA